MFLCIVSAETEQGISATSHVKIQMLLLVYFNTVVVEYRLRGHAGVEEGVQGDCC